MGIRENYNGLNISGKIQGISRILRDATCPEMQGCYIVIEISEKGELQNSGRSNLSQYGLREEAATTHISFF